MKIPSVPLSRWLVNDDGYVYRSSGYVGIQTDSPGGMLGLGDGYTWISQDGSQNMVFSDINAGERTLTELLSGGTGGSGWIYIEGLSGTTVSNTVYQDSGNTVLQSATVSSLSFNVGVKASYPLVEVDGNSATLTRDSGEGFYDGYVPITISGDGNISAVLKTPDGANGATDTISITTDLPPELLTLSFTGGYPGSQTELKDGDTFNITGTTDVSANAIEIDAYGASDSTQLLTFATGTSFTVTVTIGDRGTSTQALPIRARARNVAGAFGSQAYTNGNDPGNTVDGQDRVNLNNLYPSVNIGSVTYPASQQALKNSEQATVVNTISSYDTVVYDSPNGDLSITSTTIFQNPKTVTRIAGSYNISTNNFRITANRAANDATTIDQDVVNIANVAATISVTEPAARLRSGGNDGTSIQNHTITITGNQLLLDAYVDADSGGGTFTGSWSGSAPDATWTRVLQVHDDDTKGTYTWQNPYATNMAGIATTAITGNDEYVLGGFVQRSLTFAAFSQTTTMNVEVITYTKLQAGIFTATNQPALRNAVQGDTSDISNTYTVTALASNPTTVFWNDLSAANSNSSGTAQITDVEETV